MHSGHYPPPVLMAAVVSEDGRARLLAAEAEIIRLRLLLATQARTIAALERRNAAEHEAGQIRCSRCRHWLDSERFVHDRTRANGRRSWCRDCDREWRETHPKVRAV